MSIPILATKLFVPPSRPQWVRRPHLIRQLNESAPQRKLTLISAPAGFGKTTLIIDWVNQKTEGSIHPSKIAWLSLDEDDNDTSRFLAYLIAALQTVEPTLGTELLTTLQAPQPPTPETILTYLLNEITAVSTGSANAVSTPILLILDDYHLITAKPIDKILTFLLEHLPPHMHLVIATREDPPLPLARYRARDQLTELRASDLRFTNAEAATFLNQVMHLRLSAADIAALEQRTEGWIAGLQLAALAIQKQENTAHFIQSFTGSHHFVLDYLLEEVLHQQPPHVQTFLLRTSLLNRLCAPLCDALVCDPAIPGQEMIAVLEQANLFIIPLDSERRWYRYHHLFADLLRQRLSQSLSSAKEEAEQTIAELHSRASQWYEDNDLIFEAFHHAAAAHDIARAERLIRQGGMPLHFRGAITAILNWLASLPKAEMDARPSLWATYAAMLLVTGQTTGVAEKLEAAETGLQSMPLDEKTKNLVGQMASAKATLALTQYQTETVLVQANRALANLHPNNLPYRATANWALGAAYMFQKERAKARQAFTEALSICQSYGDVFHTTLVMSGLGEVQELENELYQAAQTYQEALRLFGEQPLPNASEVHLGLARIYYQWNDLDQAQEHVQQSLKLAQQYDKALDRIVLSQIFLARLKLAFGDVEHAAALLAETEQMVRQNHFVHQIPEVTAAQIRLLLYQGDIETAVTLAQTHNLPLSQARAHLAQADSAAALAVLEPLRQQVEARQWRDEQLKVLILQALAYHAQNKARNAVQHLGEALVLAEPGGFIRVFVDAGLPMMKLLKKMQAEEKGRDNYVNKLLVTFDADNTNHPSSFKTQPLLDPLSERELEVLQLIAEGYTNQEIADKLVLSLYTIKAHARNIYSKLNANNRTQAVNKAQEMEILPRS